MTNIEVISWPKDFPELKRVDNLLRCGICYDYMKTTMMTSCSHNYCSLCIRKYMQYKSMCPTCLEETFEVNLRCNRPLDDIITVYTGIRDKIIRHLKLAAVHLPKSNDQDQNSASPSSCSTISSSKSDSNSAKNLIQHFKDSPVKNKSIVMRLDEDVKDDCVTGIAILKSPVTPKASETTGGSVIGTPVTKIPSIFYSPKKQVPSASPASTATVSCPVCSVDIPERNINVHLDSCLARVNSPPKCGPKVLKRDPIPKRVYNMMSEKELRKWLKNYGLNATGDKKAMIARLQRYTVLFNSECDSDNPRPVFEIIRQVEKEEKDEKVVLNSFVVVKKPINRNADPNIIEVENKKYIEKNKSHFESLINAMKERDQKFIRPTYCNNRIESDSSDDEYDSYCNKDTAAIVNEPSVSGNHQVNGSIQPEFNPSLINGHSDDSNSVIEIPNSPDLSNNVKCSTVKGKKIGKSSSVKSKLDFYSIPCPIEAEVYINEDVPTSPTKTENGLETERLLEMNEIKMDVPSCNNVTKTEFSEEETNDSDESLSLLADYKQSADVEDKENEKSPTKFIEPKPQSDALFQSQISDPDFVLTESELVSTNMSEDSEDVFVPTRQSKRRRRDKVEYDLPKRVLRRKRTD